MAEQQYTLSQQDRDALVNMLRQFKKGYVYANGRPFVPDPLAKTPDILVARSPASGIPGVTGSVGTGTGFGTGSDAIPGDGGTGTGTTYVDKSPAVECDVYQIVDESGYADLIPQGFTEFVYNLSMTAIPPWTFFLAVKDKFGTWIAMPFSDNAAGIASINGDSGPLLTLEGSGTVTVTNLGSSIILITGSGITSINGDTTAAQIIESVGGSITVTEPAGGHVNLEVTAANYNTARAFALDAGTVSTAYTSGTSNRSLTGEVLSFAVGGLGSYYNIAFTPDEDFQQNIGTNLVTPFSRSALSIGGNPLRSYEASDVSFAGSISVQQSVISTLLTVLESPIYGSTIVAGFLASNHDSFGNPGIFLQSIPRNAVPPNAVELSYPPIADSQTSLFLANAGSRTGIYDGTTANFGPAYLLLKNGAYPNDYLTSPNNFAAAKSLLPYYAIWAAPAGIGQRFNGIWGNLQDGSGVSGGLVTSLGGSSTGSGLQVLIEANFTYSGGVSTAKYLNSVTSITDVSSNKWTINFSVTFTTQYEFGWTAVSDSSGVFEEVSSTTSSVTIQCTGTPTIVRFSAWGNVSLGSGGGSGGSGGTVTLNSNLVNRAINAPNLVVTGTGFSTTYTNDSIAFGTLGAAGTVASSPAPTATSATITFTTAPTTTGILKAIFTVSAVGNSGASVPVATIVPAPVITTTTTNITSSATTITITGQYFDPVGSTATFTTLGVVGTLNTALSTTTSLVFNVTTPPTTTGALDAYVICYGGQSNTTQVATVTAPITPFITASVCGMLQTTTTLTVNGFGFSLTPSQNIVSFSSGAIGAVTSVASVNQLTVTFSVQPALGPLTMVLSNPNGSTAVTQVALVLAAGPVVTASTIPIPQSQPGLTVIGTGFDSVAANNLLTFNLGAVGVVTASGPTFLQISFTTNPTSTGNLTLVVVTDCLSSGSPVQVATVMAVVTVTGSTTVISDLLTSITFYGTNFSTIPADNQVTLTCGVTTFVATCTACTSTSITVTFPGGGSFQANGMSVGDLSVNVAIVAGGYTVSNDAGNIIGVLRPPPLLFSATTVISTSATSLSITGFWIDYATPGNNVLTFSQSSGTQSGTVTAVSYPDSMGHETITVSSLTGLVAGPLYAFCTTDGIAQVGSPVEVAVVSAPSGFIQGHYASGSTVSSLTIPLGGTATAGNYLVVGVMSAGTLSGVSTNTPSGWTLLESATAGVFGFRSYLFGKVASGGETAVGLTFSASATYAEGVMCELGSGYSGGSYAGTLDQATGTSTLTGSGLTTGTTAATAAANELAFAWFSNDLTATISTPTNSFVSPSGPNAGLSYSMFSYLILTSTQTVSCGATASSSTKWRAIVATVK